MSCARRSILKPKKRCGEPPKPVAVPPQQCMFKQVKIKRKIENDAEQPLDKKLHVSNTRSDSKHARNNSFRKGNDLTHSKTHELNTPNNYTSTCSSANKYSANDRLKKYRKSLNDRTDDVIKVHSVLSSSVPKHEVSESSESIKPKRLSFNNRISDKSKTIKSTKCGSSTSLSSHSMQKRLLKVKDFNIAEMCETSVSKTMSSDVCKKSKVDQFDNNTSNLNTSINQILDEDSDIDMEWSPIEVNEVVSDIQKLRQEKSLMQMNKDQNKTESTENIYIVVDTNVFISHLTTIRGLMNLSPYATNYPVVIVPWMVVQELDFFKDGRSNAGSMENSARRAVKFINDNLTSKNERLRGQTVQEALKQDTVSSNPDDGILFCCMQLVQEGKQTVLLSNDINLRNKALIHGISSHGTVDVITEIKNLLSGCVSEKNKGERITATFTTLCSHIIENEMKLAYGTVARNLVSDPPWNLKQCLVYIKRFWQSVFSLIIPQKQFVKILDDMIYFHTSHKEISSDDDIEQFTKLCLSMCVYFKNCLVKYKDQVQRCITDIEKVID